MIKKIQTLTPTENTKTKVMGTQSKPLQTFKKSDFLTKRFLAARFHESQELIEKTIKNLQLHHASFTINGHRSPVVMDRYTDTPRVHPMALDVFKEYLEKQKAKL